MTNYRYDLYGRTEPSNIYLARPGKRLLGPLSGIDKESCSLTIDFINADELSFNVYKYHDEELTAYYGYVDILMELYVDGFGWFFIDDIPEIHNDGMDEYKSVIAKSYEQTLHQYDLVDFDVNTANPTSREMLAIDNVYTYTVSKEVFYEMFYDRVLFYRDTSEHKALLEEMSELTTLSELQNLLAKYPHVVYNDWRIQIAIDSNLRNGFATMKNATEDDGEILYWQNWIDTYDNMIASGGKNITSDTVKNILISYPNLIKYIKLDIDDNKYIQDEDGRYVESGEQYTPYQLMEREYKRIKDLSLLDLVISDLPGWEIGYVDTSLYKEHDNKLLANEVGSFEVDSQDVYSFLVTELSGYFDCVFQFDTYNNKINAYRIETLGIDTKIFLGFRNIQNSVDITPAQDLFTQFTVENSEGNTITNVNFGEREIEDISYFLNTKFLPQELIDKYKRWLEYRESRRDEYVELSRQYNKQQEKVEELKNRVPSDMLNISQLNNYTSKDQLEEVIDNYYALMIGMLNSFIFVSYEDDETVTPPRDRELYDDYNDYIADMDAYIAGLERYVNVGIDEDATRLEDSLYYKDYKMMRDFTVKNLVITYNNLSLYSFETKEEYYDSYEYNFDDNPNVGFGWMYGVNELKAYQKSHSDKMETYKEYEIPWDEIPDEDYKSHFNEDDYKEKHRLYMKYYNGYVSATQALARRQAEYDRETTALKNIGDARLALADALKMENYSESKSHRVFYELPEGWFYDEEQYYLTVEEDDNFFTDDEIAQITRFYRHTDYVNDNINYLDMIDTTDTYIDKELEMLKEAQEELYAEAHPQYTYTTAVDDLLANNEYEDFHPEFEVGNFVRLGLDDETQVQLRIITTTFNPMIWDENLQITFSNMIKYKTKRNDFATLLNSALTSAKNSINARYRKNADSDNTVQVTYDLVQKILQSSSFSNFSQNIQTGAVNAATGAFDTLSSEYLKTTQLSAELAKITELHADSAFMNYLKSNLVVANAIKAQTADVADLSTRSLTADEANIATLATEAVTAQSIDASNINVDSLTGDSAFFQYLESNLVVASEIDVDDLKAKLATIDTLSANSAFVQFLETDITTARSLSAASADIATLATESLTARSIGAENITTDNLTAQSAIIQYLQSNLIVTKALEADSVKAEDIDFTNASGATAFIDFIQAHSISTENLKAAVAEIDTLDAGSAFVNYLQGLSSTVAQSTITDAYIYNAVAGKITVADLAAGDIVLGNQMRILTNSGATEGMVMSGSELQFLDGNGNPSISIGYNTVSDGQGGTTVDYDHPAIVIKDSNGSVMLNSSGLSQGDVGLASMIQTSSISKNQLNFPIVDTDENGNISITNVLDPEGGSFGVEYTNFKNNTNNALNEIENTKMYRVVVESDNGNIFKNGDINCTLSCRVYSWDDEITDDINAANFTWTRKSKNATDDTAWNSRHAGGTKSITLTPSDVYGRSVFYCTVTLPDGTEITGS